MFLSDTDPGYRLLEDLQRIAWEKNPEAFRWVGSDEQKRDALELAKKLDSRTEVWGDSLVTPADVTYEPIVNDVFEQLDRPLPTRYEEPLTAWMLGNISKRLDERLSADSPEWKSPRIGALPIATLNARAIPPSASEPYVVVVRSGLIEFCFEMVKIALKTLTFTPELDYYNVGVGEEDFNNGPRKDPNLLIRLTYALSDLSTNRGLQHGELPESGEDVVLYSMFDAILMFAVAHEFGHVFLGHNNNQQTPLLLADDSLRTQAAKLGDRAIRVVERNWGQECFADLFGYNMLAETNSRSGKRQTWHYRLLAPVFYFAISGIAEEARFIMTQREPPPSVSDSERMEVEAIINEGLEGELTRLESPAASDTSHQDRIPAGSGRASSHPPNWARELMMMRRWEEDLGPLTEVEYSYTRMGLAMIRNLKVLWEDLKPVWIQAAREPQQPAQDR